ncbi:MAG: hypothetical protein LBL76_03085 [Treponema sp.]|jgi:hypothetical protein|nr:hypothetical protein [Treponema sp.]
MKRMELIANRSVETELIGALEQGVEGFYYTLLPQVHGRGETAYHLGTATWPEENFMLISYLENHEADRAKTVVQEVKARFSGEGIKLFLVDVGG